MQGDRNSIYPAVRIRPVSLRLDLMGNSDLEYMAALRYVIDKSWAVRTYYDSDMGFGIGVAVTY